MESKETKLCKQCRRVMKRHDTHSDLQWEQKETCYNNCRVKYSQRHGKRGVPYDLWEPTEAELAEIEAAKLECRLREIGHLRVCVRTDG